MINKRSLLCFIFLFILCGCDNTKDEEVLLEQVSNPNSVLSIEDFTNSGFKIVENYDVSELENSTDAYFGWMKDKINNPRDYELRFYDSHNSALESKNIIEEVIGENAVLASREVSWKEGNSDRRVNRRGAGSGPGSAKAKYLHYIIFGNTVVLCEGLGLEESEKLCASIIDKVITRKEIK